MTMEGKQQQTKIHSSEVCLEKRSFRHDVDSLSKNFESHQARARMLQYCSSYPSRNTFHNDIAKLVVDCSIYSAFVEMTVSR